MLLKNNAKVLVIGTNILEYINEDDHEELIYMLTKNHTNQLISFSNRFKSTLIKTQTPINQQQSILNNKFKNVNNGWRVIFENILNNFFIFIILIENKKVDANNRAKKNGEKHRL